MSEYFILLPLGSLIDIIIIRSMKKRRAWAKELEELKRRIKLYKMTSIALGSVTGALLINTCRGAESDNFLDVSDITCGIGEGFSYVDNVRVRKIITSLYRHKARNGVIFITGATVCHIAKLYEVNFPALPIPIQDFGITSMFQFMKKLFVTTLVVTGVPITWVEGIMTVFGTTFIGLALMLSVYRFANIPTIVIDTQTIKKVEPRIPTIIDIVAVNIENTGRAPKITKPECYLPIQNIMNSNWKSNVIDTSVSENQLNIDPTSIVTMKDVTGLEKVTFSDEFFFQEIPRKEKLVQSRPKAKMVTFAEKFKNTYVDDDFSTDEADTSSLRDTSNPKTGIKIKEKLDDFDPD